MTAEKIIVLTVDKDMGGYRLMQLVEDELIDSNPSKARIFSERARYEAKLKPKKEDDSWAGYDAEKVIDIAKEFGVTVSFS